jgi:hypothetical protein
MTTTGSPTIAVFHVAFTDASTSLAPRVESGVPLADPSPLTPAPRPTMW